MTLTPDPATGMLTGTTLGVATDVVTYDAYGAPSLYTANVNTTALWSVNPTPDNLGRILKLTETIQGQSHSFGYQYDVDGHLTDVFEDGVPLSHYDYDGNGNRIGYTAAGQTKIVPTYDAQDRLMTYGGTSYTYTMSGELLTKTDATGATSYTYDELGNLRAVTLADGTPITYVVDGAGHRVQKTKNGTAIQGFLWSGGLRIAAELDGSGNVVSRFVYGTRINVPDVMVKGGTRTAAPPRQSSSDWQKLASPLGRESWHSTLTATCAWLGVAGEHRSST